MGYKANPTSGEYFVAAELLRRGFNASVTVGNMKTVDILASGVDGSNPVSIQVKTTGRLTGKNAKRYWMLNEKCEKHNKNLFYVFVGLRSENERPEFHIVDSQTVAEYIKAENDSYNAGIKKNGQPRKATNMRQFDIDNDRFLDRWEILK